LNENKLQTPSLIYDLLTQSQSASDKKNKFINNYKLISLTNSKPRYLKKTLGMNNINNKFYNIPNSPIKWLGKETKSYKHYIPASKEWSSSIYSFNKSNLIFAPQVSNLTYKLSKSYLNASPKHKTMDNIFIVKGRSQENFSKILFNLKSTNISNSSRSQSVSEDSISEKKKKI